MKAWLMTSTAWQGLPPIPKEIEWWTRAYCKAVLAKIAEAQR